MDIQYTTAQNELDLQGILDLQQLNLAKNVSAQEALEQGFLTVEHNLELLTRMNTPYPHVIAKVGEQVVGYTLVMLKELKYDIPILFPMFEQIEQINYQGKLVSAHDYFVMGQVCVASAYRSQGVFANLYQTLKTKMSPYYSLVVTEVAFRNTRSMRAHEKVGFKVIKDYRSEEEGEHWAIVAWDLR